MSTVLFTRFHVTIAGYAKKTYRKKEYRFKNRIKKNIDNNIV